MPANSDLVLVETSHQAAAAAEPSEEPATRAHRVRPPRREIADEPLQLIETAHKDPNPPVT
ncbi:MAG TPA: hypothetical protein VJQ49_03985 [Casimicrobiaceae bacterium]|nr:hypothetical protein [Casimicrobiaceae bacterium]